MVGGTIEGARDGRRGHRESREDVAGQYRWPSMCMCTCTDVPAYTPLHVVHGYVHVYVICTCILHDGVAHVHMRLWNAVKGLTD